MKGIIYSLLQWHPALHVEEMPFDQDGNLKPEVRSIVLRMRHNRVQNAWSSRADFGSWFHIMSDSARRTLLQMMEARGLELSQHRPESVDPDDRAVAYALLIFLGLQAGEDYGSQFDIIRAWTA